MGSPTQLLFIISRFVVGGTVAASSAAMPQQGVLGPHARCAHHYNMHAVQV